jgi:hypothetical protein
MCYDNGALQNRALFYPKVKIDTCSILILAFLAGCAIITSNTALTETDSVVTALQRDAAC